MPTPTRLLAAVAALAVTTGLAVMAVAGCTKLDTFVCAESSECVNGGLAGTCEPGGLCSFPEPECPSGKKFGDFSGDMSGQCVGSEPGPTTTMAESSPPTTSISDSGTDSSSDDGTTIDFTSTTQTSQATATTTTDPTATTLTTTTTTDPSETDTPGPTAPTCSDIGGACGGAVTCCGPCMACIDGLCIVPDATGGICPQCQECFADGYCGPSSPEVTCETNCSDIIYKEEVVAPKTACYSYGDLPTKSVCDGAGACSPPDPVLAGCPDPLLLPDSPIKFVECDSVCKIPADLCVPGNSASALPLAAYCALNQPFEGCVGGCTVDADNLPAADQALCDGQGVCTHNLTSCDPYVCDANTNQCLVKCNDSTDCVSSKCQGTKCQ